MPTSRGDRSAVAGRPPVLSRRHLLLVVVGPVSLAVAGSFHPALLTAGAAERWHDLHVVMLPLFPLLALMIWVLLRGVRRGLDGVLAAAARLLAVVFGCFYTALDVLAGVADGAIVTYGADTGTDIDGVKALIFGEAGDLGDVGVWAMLAACALTAVVYVRRLGLVAVPGSAVLLVSAWSFLDSHVYPPRGVVTMLGFGLGALLLAVPLLRDRRGAPHRP